MRLRRFASRAKAVLDNLCGEDWASIHFKVALGILWPALFVINQGTLAQHLGMVFIGIWLGAAAVGTVTSLVGMIMTAQAGMVRLRGFRVELVGLILFLSGPLVYFAVQVGILWSNPSTDRLQQMVLAYALTAAVIMRIIKVQKTAKRALNPGKLINS